MPLSLKSSESISDERSEKRVGDDGDGDSDGDDGRSGGANNFALINAVSASSAAKDTLCACDRWLRSRTCTSEEDLDDDEGGGGGGGRRRWRAPQMEKGACGRRSHRRRGGGAVAMTSPPSSKDGARDRRCVERGKVTVTDTEDKQEAQQHVLVEHGKFLKDLRRYSVVSGGAVAAQRERKRQLRKPYIA